MIRSSRCFRYYPFAEIRLSASADADKVKLAVRAGTTRLKPNWRELTVAVAAVIPQAERVLLEAHRYSPWRIGLQYDATCDRNVIPMALAGNGEWQVAHTFRRDLCGSNVCIQVVVVEDGPAGHTIGASEPYSFRVREQRKTLFAVMRKDFSEDDELAKFKACAYVHDLVNLSDDGRPVIWLNEDKEHFLKARRGTGQAMKKVVFLAAYSEAICHGFSHAMEAIPAEEGQEPTLEDIPELWQRRLLMTILPKAMALVGSGVEGEFEDLLREAHDSFGAGGDDKAALLSAVAAAAQKNTLDLLAQAAGKEEEKEGDDDE